jgi:hypothetical protein
MKTKGSAVLDFARWFSPNPSLAPKAWTVRVQWTIALTIVFDYRIAAVIAGGQGFQAHRAISPEDARIFLC